MAKHKPASSTSPSDPDLTPALVTELVQHFERISRVLYDTRIPTDEIELEVLPHIDEEIVFVDPWQTGHGRDKYRLGAAGFHAMLSFTLDIKQVNVQLEPDGHRGRAIVDSVMHLTPLGPRLSYPLRTILTYEFTLDSAPEERPARFRILRHEEMWSLGDMIEALPVSGWLYKKLFRPAFSYGFLGASYLTCKLKGSLPSAS